MSNYVKSSEVITVDKLTKFGVRVKDKNYSYGKFYTGEQLQAGKTYEIEVATSPIGAKYINTAKEAAPVSRTVSSGPTIQVATTEIEPLGQKPAPAPAFGSSLSPADKDTRILVQGVLQAVIQSPTLGLSGDESIEDAVERVTRRYVEFVRNFGK